MLILEQIPMRQDNYTYALIHEKNVIMIDPSNDSESLAYFAANPSFKLVAILNTHSHIDHIGGNEVLWQKWRCPVYGPKAESDRITRISHLLEDGDIFSILGIEIRSHDVAAHTIGHMAYYVDFALDKIIKHAHGRPQFFAPNLSAHKALFVGDSLFAAGCGRLFEGSRENLAKMLSFFAAQDPETLMVCAHEYTKSNLKFAQSVFPDNLAIKERAKALDQLLAVEGSSIPCLFKEEFATNPFLLALSEPGRSILAREFSLEEPDLPTLVGSLRDAKDAF